MAGANGALAARLDAAVAQLPRAWPGPGGAVAVLRAGEVLVRHAWGYANAELRIPFTPASLFRICSISKQFTCATLLDLFPDPSALDADLAARLPGLGAATPTVARLCHNQSGLRDYWAVAMLHGAPAEAPFGERDARRVIETAGSQFAPGTRYSYCNQNFRLLSDLLEARTGRGFAELVRSRVFDRAGMAGAIVAADTRALPDGTEGYEGTQAGGFRAAENRIAWTGDAGLAASLDDMIAWERHIDATREDAASLYQRLSAPVSFADGTAAGYGFGLARTTEFGRPATGHGGALRGWRSHRLWLPGERISVVVMFNHLSDASAAAQEVLAAALGETLPKPDETLAAPAWLGAWVEPETGLLVRIDAAEPGRVRLRHATAPDLLDLQPDVSARSRRGTVLRPVDGGLWMDRTLDNLSSRLVPVSAGTADDVAGRYRCEALGTELEIVDAGGALYGAFAGFLGRGRMELLDPVGPDLWALPCPRALDHSPPGDWTLAFRRDESGRAACVSVGCWLARGFSYERVG